MRIRNVVRYAAAVLVSLALAFAITTIVFLTREKLPWKRLPGWAILAMTWLRRSPAERSPHG